MEKVNINQELIQNLLEQSRILLEKSLLLSENVKTVSGEDTRLLISNVGSSKEKIMQKILKESEQIRKNSAQVLSNVLQILDMSEDPKLICQNSLCRNCIIKISECKHFAENIRAKNKILEDQLYLETIEKIDKCKTFGECKQLIMDLSSEYGCDFEHRGTTHNFPRKRIWMSVLPRIYSYIDEIFPEKEQLQK